MSADATSVDLIARALQLLGAWAAKYLQVYRILFAKRAESLVFLGLTIFVGALGLWAPPLIASVNAHDSTKEFVKALEVGAGYMFALSTVATAMTFFAKEYLADHHSDFKEIKTVGAVVAGCLILVMMVLLAIQIMAGILDSSKPPTVASLVLQSLLTIAAFMVALYLFCLEQIDECPDLGVDLKDRSKAALRRKIDDAQDPDLHL